jgi:hypothetical protein
MLLLLVACVVESEIAPVDVEVAPVDQPVGMTGAPSQPLLMILGADPADPRLVEVDRTGAVVLDFPLADLFEDWDTRGGKPNPMDVEPLGGGEYLVSFHDGGLIQFRPDNGVTWRLDDAEASHDVDRLPNGNTLYARSWVAQGEDVVREVDPSGNTVWSWSGADAFPDELDGYEDEGGAWMHVNSVQRLADGTTSIAARNFNEVLIVAADGSISRRIGFESPPRSTGPVTQGNLQGMHPHGTEWADGGGLTVALRRPERIVSIRGGVKQWERRDDSLVGITDFDTLPNGNLLVATHGIAREVAPSGEVVWQWDQLANTVDEGTDRARHVFNTIAPLDANGLAIDLD